MRKVLHILATGFLLAWFLMFSGALSFCQSLAVIRDSPLPSGIKARFSSDDEVQCDSTDNILVELQSEGNEDAHALLKLSPAGAVVFVSDIKSVPGFERAMIDTFAQGADGNTYALSYEILSKSVKGNSRSETISTQGYLLVFSDTGKFDHSVKLPKVMLIQRIAVFSNGNILAIGRTDAKTPKTILFSPSGEIIKDITFPDNLTRVEQTVDSQALAMDWVRIRVPSDGNAYVLSGRYSPKVSVIAPDGTIISSVKLQLPNGVQDLWHEQFEPGRLVARLQPRLVEGQRVPPIDYGIFDATSGQLLQRYSVPSEIDWNLYLACAKSATMTFLAPTSVKILAPSH